MDITVEQLDGLILEIAVQRALCTTKKELLKVENKKLSELEFKAFGYLESMGKQDYRSDIASISRSEKLYYKLPQSPEAKKEYFDYLKERELFDSMVTVNAASHNSFCNQEMDAAEDEMTFQIPGIDAPSMHKKLRFTKR